MTFPPPPFDDAHRRGDRVGRLELVRCIGVGGMGSVWEAKHESLKRRVAIKFINLAHVHDEDAQRRFETEARAASSLQSRHVVEMFDHGRTDSGEPFIVMEFLVGESLEQRLRREGRLRLDETAAVVVQVARALQQAHDLGIIHRDLKPDNIFLAVDEEPGAFVAKVLDFGVAKVSGASASLGDAKTKTGALMGTPYYMAPEQARGAKELDARADLWSLGVIAYRCVSGVLPFESDALGELLVSICTGIFLPASSVVRDLPPSFDRWVARALTVDPARRFASATELAQALADVAAERGRLDHTFDRALSVAPNFAFASPRISTAGTIDALAVTHASMPPSAQSPISDHPAPRSERSERDTGTSARPSGTAAPSRIGIPLAAALALLAVLGTVTLLRRSRANAEAPAPHSAPAASTTTELDAGATQALEDSGLTNAEHAPSDTPRAPSTRPSTPAASPHKGRRLEGTSADPGF